MIKRARDVFIGALIVSPWLVYQCVAIWIDDTNWKNDLAYRIGKIDMENTKFWPKRKNFEVRGLDVTFSGTVDHFYFPTRESQKGKG